MPQPEGETWNPMDEVFSPFRGVFEDEEDKEKEENQKSFEDAKSPTKQNQYSSPDEKGTGKNKRGAFVKEDYVFTAETAPGDKRRQRINRSPGKQTVLKSEEDLSSDFGHHSSELSEWFDLRQAVIYSEILKRPDY